MSLRLFHYFYNRSNAVNWGKTQMVQTGLEPRAVVDLMKSQRIQQFDHGSRLYEFNIFTRMHSVFLAVTNLNAKVTTDQMPPLTFRSQPHRSF